MASELLNGLVVLNTRPSHQQQALTDAVEASGGKTVSMPLLRIDPVSDSAQLQELRNRIDQSDQWDALVFISANAVAIGAPLLKEAIPQLPSSLELFAIGSSTAAELHKHFTHEVLQPESGTTSEALLDLPRLQSIEDQELVIVRGVGGRETLRETLEQRGARVHYLEVYSRHPTRLSAQEFIEGIEENGVNVLVVTSGESLQRMLELSADNKGSLTLLPLIVPSARIAALAKEAGFTRVIEAAGAGESAIVAALVTIADNFG